MCVCVHQHIKPPLALEVETVQRHITAATSTARSLNVARSEAPRPRAVGSGLGCCIVGRLIRRPHQNAYLHTVHPPPSPSERRYVRAKRKSPQACPASTDQRGRVESRTKKFDDTPVRQHTGTSKLSTNTSQGQTVCVCVYTNISSPLARSRLFKRHTHYCVDFALAVTERRAVSAAGSGLFCIVGRLIRWPPRRTRHTAIPHPPSPSETIRASEEKNSSGLSLASTDQRGGVESTTKKFDDTAVCSTGTTGTRSSPNSGGEGAVWRRLRYRIIRDITEQHEGAGSLASFLQPRGNTNIYIEQVDKILLRWGSLRLRRHFAGGSEVSFDGS